MKRPRIDVVALLLSVAAVAAALTVRALVRTRYPGSEYRASRSLYAIKTAEEIFRNGAKRGDGNLDYGMLSELVSVGLVDSSLATGTKFGYLFEATYSFSTSEFLWFGRATPIDPGFSGDRYFAVNQAGVVYYTTGAPFALDTNSCLLPTNGGIAGK